MRVVVKIKVPFLGSRTILGTQKPHVKVSFWVHVHVAGFGADLFRPGIQVVTGNQEFQSVRV